MRRHPRPPPPIPTHRHPPPAPADPNAPVPRPPPWTQRTGSTGPAARGPERTRGPERSGTRTSSAEEPGRVDNAAGNFSYVVPQGWVVGDASKLNYGQALLSKEPARPSTGSPHRWPTTPASCSAGWT